MLNGLVKQLPHNGWRGHGLRRGEVETVLRPSRGSQPGFLEQQHSVPRGTCWPLRDLGLPRPRTHGAGLHRSLGPVLKSENCGL